MSCLQLFMTEGARVGYLGGKTSEPSISSSEANDSNKSIVIADPKFQIVMPDPESMIPNARGERPRRADVSRQSARLRNYGPSACRSGAVASCLSSVSSGEPRQKRSMKKSDSLPMSSRNRSNPASVKTLCPFHSGLRRGFCGKKEWAIPLRRSFSAARFATTGLGMS